MLIDDLDIEWELLVVVVEDPKGPESFGTNRLAVAKRGKLRAKK
ncbi:MAG TPA: hypothetical protein VGV87_03080 [Blastocatellia bacterium]|nr:hypothetical protein [Blastocatellia bacterium]